MDIVVMESFFDLLKIEPLYLQEFQSMEYFEKEPIQYYSNRRRKAKFKGLVVCNLQTTSPFGRLDNLF